MPYQNVKEAGQHNLTLDDIMAMGGQIAEDYIAKVVERASNPMKAGADAFMGLVPKVTVKDGQYEADNVGLGMGGLAGSVKRGLGTTLDQISKPLGKGMDRLRNPPVRTEYVEVPTGETRFIEPSIEAQRQAVKDADFKPQQGATEPTLQDIASGFTPEPPNKTLYGGPENMNFVPNSLSQLKGFDKGMPLTSVITGEGAGDLIRSNPDLLDKTIRALSPDTATATAQKALYPDDVLLNMENSKPGTLLQDLVDMLGGSKQAVHDVPLNQVTYDKYLKKIESGVQLTPAETKYLDDFEDL